MIRASPSMPIFDLDGSTHTYSGILAQQKHWNLRTYHVTKKGDFNGASHVVYHSLMASQVGR